MISWKIFFSRRFVVGQCLKQQKEFSWGYLPNLMYICHLPTQLTFHFILIRLEEEEEEEEAFFVFLIF